LVRPSSGRTLNLIWRKIAVAGHAVDQNEFVLDVLVQCRRDSRAAQRFLGRLLRWAVAPSRFMITDKLRSNGAARTKMGLRIEHRQHKGLNNRAENSHQPTRRRERIMKRFKSADRRSYFCRFTIRSPTFFTFPIQGRRPLRNVAPYATAPLPFGAISPRQQSRSKQAKSLKAYCSCTSLR
jgi:putative transposase